MRDYSTTTRRLALATLITAALFSGCAPVSLQTESVQTAEQAIASSERFDNLSEQQRFLLRTAARFQDEGDHSSARRILQASPLQQAEDEISDQQVLLSMASIVALEDVFWAESVSKRLTPDHYQRYPEERQAAAVQLQFQVLGMARETLGQALLLMSAGPELSGMEPQAHQDQIWQALKRLTDEQLNEAAASAIGFESQGWLELAARMREPGLSLEAQGRIVRDWRFNWLGHPAAELPPSELDLIATLLQSQPAHIALALPLSGPLAAAGEMVRDGFLAAYYQEQMERAAAADERGELPDVRITVTDTHGRSATDLLQILMRTDPDLVVGPLEKDMVTELSSMQELPVPVLALNYSGGDQARAPAALTQFGLAPEDEARQIADQLAEEGLLQVITLIPRGDWGDRVERALTERLNTHGGTVINGDRYFGTDNFRDITANVLGINTSRQRALELQRTLGRNLEFEPRRRQDVDAIVMVAQPTIARQFKPLFAFYYASDVPVLSPSIIYEGQPDPSRDRDLNGVRFTDVPWILDKGTQFRQQVRSEMPDTEGPLGRLFAMGADAWALSSRLPLMQQIENTRYAGHTGVLSMDPAGRIHRTQMWAKFESGTPVLELPEPDAEITED